VKRLLVIALLAAPAWAGNANVIYYNGKKWDDRYGAPQHFTGEMSYRDSQTGQVQSVETYANGVLDGPFKHYDLKGVLDETGNNRNGKRSGPFKRYRNGKLQDEWSYVGGELSGVQRSYRDGVLERVYYVDPATRGSDTELYFNKAGQLTNLRCGRHLIGKQDTEWCGGNGKESTVTIYSDAGKVRETQHYLWGKKSGTWKRFNVTTGATMSEEQYADGKRVGEKSNDASGNPLWKSDCDNQHKACTETELFAGGKETKVVTVYKNGKTVERTEKYQNGNVREHLVASGDHFQIDRFDDEGRPESKGTYVFASDWSWQPYLGDGTIEYYLGGELARREKLVRGSREGLTQAWWTTKDHKIREDSEYAKDQVVRQKIFVDDRLAVTLEFMPDGSLKSRTVVTAPPKDVIDI